jgi:transposase InsO family protein
MNVHKNARLTPLGRERIVRQVASGQPPEAVSEAAGVCPRTVRKWVDRYHREGSAGLQDRSSRPHRLHRPTPQTVVEQIEQLRRQRWTGKQIAAETGVSPATVSRVLRRLGLNKLSSLEPAEPIRRYERDTPGELIHIDIKKLGRIGSVGHRITGRRPGVVNRHLGIGWEYVHVCIDDASRVAFVQVMANQRKESAVAFLEAAVAYYAKLGIRIERVMTDNGSCYRGVVHQLACRTLGLKHLRTRPYRPRTNGKAERFIRTLLGGWAYGAIYRDSDERRRALPGWLDFYNHRRPHGSLSHQPPLQRLDALSRNNLAGSYT